MQISRGAKVVVLALWIVTVAGIMIFMRTNERDGFSSPHEALRVWAKALYDGDYGTFIRSTYASDVGFASNYYACVTEQYRLQEAIIRRYGEDGFQEFRFMTVTNRCELPIINRPDWCAVLQITNYPAVPWSDPDITDIASRAYMLIDMHEPTMSGPFYLWEDMGKYKVTIDFGSRMVAEQRRDNIAMTHTNTLCAMRALGLCVSTNVTELFDQYRLLRNRK